MNSRFSYLIVNAIPIEVNLNALTVNVYGVENCLISTH